MSGEAPGVLTALEDLRARLLPGALCFSLATAAEAEALRPWLSGWGRVWLGWRRREELLRAWRPAVQERYHSVAGRDAPALEDWLGERFKEWRRTGRGDWRPEVDRARLDSSLSLCGLEALARQPLSLLSNGEAARACLAEALAGRPEALVLDDLSEGLDAAGRRTLLDAARALAGQGAAVLVLASRESLLPWGPAPAPFSAAGASGGPPSDGGPGEEIFSCEGLVLEAGERCLVRGLDWRLRAGEFWLVAGPNGAGKSTLLAYLSGEHPQAWAQSWRLQGLERPAWTPPDALRREIAWVSPEWAAFSGRTLAAELKRALEGPARLILLDEALRGFGPGALAAQRASLAAALKRGGRCVVFVSHDPSELPEGVNRVLRLRGGGAWSVEGLH